MSNFDEYALAIAKKQYLLEGETIEGMFKRVANFVAQAEDESDRGYWADRFYEIMVNKKFCPGGRVLAGAMSSHGNVLNCFVQDGIDRGEDELNISNSDSLLTDEVLRLATRLALVTKVGGGNGLCLDKLPPKKVFNGAGKLYITISPNHPDYDKVKSGTFFDQTSDTHVSRGYRYAEFINKRNVPKEAQPVDVDDSVKGIWEGAARMVQALLLGHSYVVDLSDLRPEGTPVKGSGGSSSGPSSFAVEVFDNFGLWASLGGAGYAGPVATLRYVYAPTLRVIRQAGVRRGAGMATLSDWHPDILDFITSKDLEREAKEGDISTFNISVLATDEFMNTNKALLSQIAKHAWLTGEPGLIFIDRINEHNPMRRAFGDIKSTNPLTLAA